jgi:nicotinate-nucleotide adenylyltransferase
VNVAVFGGSFNPPHLAHVLACALVLATEEVDVVLVVPTYRHAFAKALAPFDDRVRMCELAMASMPQTTVSRVEEELGGDSYTLRTLQHLARTNPAWRLRLVIGADILAETPRWMAFDEVAKLAPPIVLGRAGIVADTAGPPLLPEVSSTAVRDAMARGAWSDLSSLVPRNVVAYARERGLYAAPT